MKNINHSAKNGKTNKWNFLTLAFRWAHRLFPKLPTETLLIWKTPIKVLFILVTGNHSMGHHRPRFQRGLFGSIAKGLKIDGQHLGTAVYNKRSPLENRESIFLSDLQGHFHDCYLYKCIASSLLVPYE